MNQKVSPAVAAGIIAVILGVVGFLGWKSTQKNHGSTMSKSDMEAHMKASMPGGAPVGSGGGGRPGGAGSPDRAGSGGGTGSYGGMGAGSAGMGAGSGGHQMMGSPDH